MNGGGNHTRSFMYISDLVEGLVRLMDSNYTQPVNLVRLWAGKEGGGMEEEGTLVDYVEIHGSCMSLVLHSAM